MRIFLTGIACVGKSTIGAKLAELLGCRFFDLDQETEEFFGTSLTRLRRRLLTVHSYREEAAKALVHVLTPPESQDCVIALSPSGLMGGYWRVVKKAEGTTVVLRDEPENILDRIRFYDDDSRPIDKHLTEKEKRLYLREIKKDMTYFRKAYERADMQIDISGLNADEAAAKVKRSVESIPGSGHRPRQT